MEKLTMGKEQRAKEYEARRKLEMTDWNDLKDDQKIERMRGMIIDIGNTARSGKTTADNLKKAFSEHKHAEGELVVRYREYSQGFGDSEGIRRAKNYF